MIRNLLMLISIEYTVADRVTIYVANILNKKIHIIDIFCVRMDILKNPVTFMAFI